MRAFEGTAHAPQNAVTFLRQYPPAPSAQPVRCHSFLHSFAIHLFEAGYHIRTVQELLGGQDVRTTMIYTHVLNKGGRGVRSPVDGL